MARLLALTLASIVAFPSQTEGRETPRTPNFIIIFCDDLGYGDIGCFGSTVHRTPHIDRMAAQGMRLTSFYVSSGVCTPSRASLLTGCYPPRIGMHINSDGSLAVLLPGEPKGLHPDEVTIAELLKARGYATACIGKWHLGDQPDFSPTRQGFDYYFGVPFSNDMGQEIRPQYRDDPKFQFPPLPLMRNEQVIETEPDQRQITRRYTQEAVAFIEANKDRPFFLYLPHTMPHWPHYASESFAGRSGNGVYGDSVEELDWSVGQILDALRQRGIDGRTLVIFTSDNGGLVADGASNGRLRGGKGTTFEGGLRVPCIVRWPGTVPAGTESGEIVTTMDLLPTLAALAGAGVPSDRIIDGRDIRPLIFGQPGAKSPHEAFLYYRKDRLEAVRSGKWKLRLSPPAPQLYDLEADIGENSDIAADHAAVVDRLLALGERAREDLGDRGRLGKHRRPAGWVRQTSTLTSQP